MTSLATHTASVCPYPGLRPFECHEVDIFFGREMQVDQMLAKLSANRFLALVGTSGCGKSSLAKAGLIPALGMGLISETGHRWRVATLKPGESPQRNLADALLKTGVLGPVSAGDNGRPTSELREYVRAGLRRGPLGLAEVLADPLTPGAGPALPDDHNLMLLVDQFEEIFRYRRCGDSKEADAFVAMLVATAQQSQVPVFVVITMRSDYLGDCAVFEGLPEVLNDSQFLTPRLSREQRREAIEGPAGVFGGEVEPALVGRLLNDMGPDPDQLPLMQHVLRRLWEMAESTSGDGKVCLRLKDYLRVGGLERALHGHAEEVYEKRLSAVQKRVAEILFRCLSERETAVRDSIRRDIRRPTLLRDVAQVAKVSEDNVISVVDVFREPALSFLTPPAIVPLTGSTMLDVSHESLIRRWDRLQGWVDDEAELAKTFLRYDQSARLWKRGETGLLVHPELDYAREWLRSPITTSTWAQRYEGDFALATEYVEASEAQYNKDCGEQRAREIARLEEEKRELLEREKARHEHELEERERQQKSEAQLRKVRFFKSWLASALVAFLVVLVLAVSAYRGWNRADEGKKKADQERSQLRFVVEEVGKGVLNIIHEVPKDLHEEVYSSANRPETRPGANMMALMGSFFGQFEKVLSASLQRAVLRRAITHYNNIVSEKGPNVDILRGRGLMYRELGRLHFRDGKYEKSAENFSIAVEDTETALERLDDRDDSAEDSFRRDLSQSYTDRVLASSRIATRPQTEQDEHKRQLLWRDPIRERVEKARELTSWLTSDSPTGLEKEIADQAMSTLKQALDLGAGNAYRVIKESVARKEFGYLQDRDDFKQLVAAQKD
jgi:hypothetical protein